MKALVLLHGWGMTPAAFDDLRDALEGSYALHALPLPGYCGAPSAAAHTVEALAKNVAQRAPPRCCVVGWSLGGQVAIEWARRAPEQVEALALVGSTPSFVQRNGWSHAVEAGVFDAFVEGMRSDRDATLKRFASLQARNDSAMKAVAMRLRACTCREQDASTDTLLGGLRVLVETDVRASLDEVRQEALVVHGECDRLVPLAAAEALSRSLKRATLQPVPCAAHAPFVGRRDAVAAALREFFA